MQFVQPHLLIADVFARVDQGCLEVHQCRTGAATVHIGCASRGPIAREAAAAEMIEARRGAGDNECENQAGESEQQYRFARMQPQAARPRGAGACGLARRDDSTATWAGSWSFQGRAVHQKLVYRKPILLGERNKLRPCAQHAPDNHFPSKRNRQGTGGENQTGRRGGRGTRPLT